MEPQKLSTTDNQVRASLGGEVDQILDLRWKVLRRRERFLLAFLVIFVVGGNTYPRGDTVFVDRADLAGPRRVAFYPHSLAPRQTSSQSSVMDSQVWSRKTIASDAETLGSLRLSMGTICYLK